MPFFLPPNQQTPMKPHHGSPVSPLFILPAQVIHADNQPILVVTDQLPNFVLVNSLVFLQSRNKTDQIKWFALLNFDTTQKCFRPEATLKTNPLEPRWLRSQLLSLSLSLTGLRFHLQSIRRLLRIIKLMSPKTPRVPILQVLGFIHSKLESPKLPGRRYKEETQVGHGAKPQFQHLCIWGRRITTESKARLQSIWLLQEWQPKEQASR